MHSIKVFLDIDGVLNNTNHTMSYTLDEYRTASKQWRIDYGTYMLNPNCVYGIIKAIHYLQTYYVSVDVILSSTWRLGGSKVIGKLNNIFNAFGYLDIMITDVTPRLGTIRGLEVAKYMKSYKNTEYIIIDDDSDFTREQIKHHLFLCDNNDGFVFEKFKIYFDNRTE